MWPEIQRKLFHLTALIYVVGAIYLPRKSYLLILAAALILEGLFEWSRLKIPAVRAFIERRFGGLLRAEERDRLSGMFWMLLGVFVTVAVLDSVSLTSACLLYLILGDAAASLVGIRLRGPVWPGTNKTLSGSAACLIFCLVIGMVFIKPLYGWSAVIVGAVVATVAEGGLLRLNDNIAIPVSCALVFRLFYSVPL